MNRHLFCLSAGIVFGLSSASAFALSKEDIYDSLDLALTEPALPFTGEISSIGQVNWHRFTVQTAAIVFIDVLADEFATDSGGNPVNPVWNGSEWTNYSDRNSDGVGTFLDSQIFLFRDDGNTGIPTIGGNLEQTKLYGANSGNTDLMEDLTDNFGIYQDYDSVRDDPNASSAQQFDPYAYHNLLAGNYILAIGADSGSNGSEKFTVFDAINGFNNDARTCSTTPGDLCTELGDYRIDILGGDAIENVTQNPVPVPAALPLFASALAFMGFAGWSKRRNLG